VKVVILCGGLGTRLREATQFRPRPISWPIMKMHSHHGFRNFVLSRGAGRPAAPGELPVSHD